MHIFYTPDILATMELPQEEAQHCIRVLRLKAGNEIKLTDGIGHFFRAIIAEDHPKHCKVEIIETISQSLPWKNNIEIALSPTKNMDRIEWLTEKMTEIGVNKISFLSCRFSERKELKLHRIEKITVAAIKQSNKAFLPQLQPMTDFNRFVMRDFDGQKFIAHCYSSERKTLSQLYKKNENVLILIGPEGDFSEDEVRKAIQCGFQPISLGESRLRTETAALAACHAIHVINQLNQ